MRWLLLVLLVVVLAGCGGGKTDTRPAAAHVGVRGDGTLDVVRVPVFGGYVTCVRYREAITTGGAGGLSCDWAGFHEARR